MMVGLCVCQQVSAQYDVSFSHYFDMETSFNPAAAGRLDKLNFTAAFAMDLAGFQHNPQTVYASVDMPFYFLRSHHGGGVLLMNDKIGLFTHQRVEGQYALKQKLLGGVLAVGVQAGMISEKFDGTKLDVEEANDPAFPTSQVNGTGFDLSVGLRYTARSWYIGASAVHLNAPVVNLGSTNELSIDPTYYFATGCNIKLRNPFLTIKPSALFRTDGVAYRADVTGRLVYTHDDKMMYGGLAYSPTNSFTVLLGGKVHGVILGYSYEVYTSAINPGNGSHEFFVGYQLDIHLAKKGRNRHKSVRLL
ncbi:PorP/SprF family type IX secretion system membrane protein [Prevotella sp. A2931]|uniref:PorP/SprF family type IX secretion system membrane protein n=1 Tax=Prevotella illustrans TaxID=2800387 RepID=A0ABS3M305_9BACT|nr:MULTISPECIES: PorP/SprF family type IX secretion system membrane protein [Prevotella]MBO1362515.1 PorP/SprF family type IX secretion system membrane protein [Prevotella illustrans]PTL26687.1 hypothetical protein C3V39_06300 [Prevotella sp. oral taxon 820]